MFGDSCWKSMAVHPRSCCNLFLMYLSTSAAYLFASIKVKRKITWNCYTVINASLFSGDTLVALPFRGDTTSVKFNLQQDSALLLIFILHMIDRRILLGKGSMDIPWCRRGREGTTKAMHGSAAIFKGIQCLLFGWL